jgi:hypothetical protein
MKAVAEADEEKRKRLVPGSAGSGSSNSAPPKYHMVYTPPGVSCVDHNSSRIGAITHNSNLDNSSSNSSSNNSSSTVPLLHHRSRLPLGHHSSFPLATFHASTMRRCATSLENAAYPSKLQHPWSISRGAIRRVLHHGRAMLTAPPCKRFPWEKKC